MTTPMRIVLVEDHRILREGLRAIFASERDLKLVGEATDGLEGIQQAKELQPDLLILDLSMPRMDGLAALKEIKRVAPKTRVLIMTAHRNEEYIFRAIDNGADGYLLKDASAAEMLLAVRSVLAGERYLSAAVATQVVAAFLNRKGGTDGSAGPRSALAGMLLRVPENRADGRSPAPPTDRPFPGKDGARPISGAWEIA